MSGDTNDKGDDERMKTTTTKRPKWEETPAGRAYEAERKAYEEWVASGGPERVDAKLCFVCQEKSATRKVTRNEQLEFNTCAECAEALVAENHRRNRIKQALGRGRGGDLFRMTLGADLLPQRLEVEYLEEPK